ncbi:hypothetical protein RN001_005792 [Aquatica leii]|uniref:HTH psq-type domain-containing protein n=1 Tax=Aquatica leii TaxID=1421715 RepID=A0AAN7PD69_9COLE|nr:hypothetical protein RN001_005792 [Aquatica leii]
MASTSVKRKHKTLSLSEKWEIIKRIDRGETPSAISKEYDIGRPTVYDIVKNREKIEKFINRLYKFDAFRVCNIDSIDSEVQTSYIQQNNENTENDDEAVDDILDMEELFSDYNVEDSNYEPTSNCDSERSNLSNATSISESARSTNSDRLPSPLVAQAAQQQTSWSEIQKKGNVRIAALKIPK